MQKNSTTSSKTSSGAAKTNNSDSKPRLKVGQFVICNFPYAEAPTKPGPDAHVCLVLNARDDWAFVIYTTSKIPTPPRSYHLRVSAEDAKELGQNKAFCFNMTRLAFVPVNYEFFPHLLKPHRGIFGKPASESLLRELNDRIRMENKRRPIRISGRPEIARPKEPKAPKMVA